MFLLDTKIKRAQVFYTGERTNFVEMIKVVDRVRPENMITIVDEKDDQAGINTLLLKGRACHTGKVGSQIVHPEWMYPSGIDSV